MTEHFDFDRHLRADSSFRTHLRAVHGLTPHEMNTYGGALSRALEKHRETHREETHLTSQNFDRVMEHLHTDAEYKRHASVYKTKTAAFEDAVRASLKIAPENEAA